MPTPPPDEDSFQQRFCRHFAVPPERYQRGVLRLTFYAPGFFVAALCGPGWFAADHAFVAAVGRVTRRQDFFLAVRDYQRDERNLRFSRRHLRLRVSVARMRGLFSEVWGNGAEAPPDPRFERGHKKAGAWEAPAARIRTTVQ